MSSLSLPFALVLGLYDTTRSWLGYRLADRAIRLLITKQETDSNPTPKLVGRPREVIVDIR